MPVLCLATQPVRSDIIWTHRRAHGGGVPEFWGRPSSYTEGTDFLGTPKNHLDVSSDAMLTWGTCAGAAPMHPRPTSTC